MRLRMATDDNERVAGTAFPAKSPFGQTFGKPPGLDEEVTRTQLAEGRVKLPLDTSQIERCLSDLEAIVGGDHEVALLLIEIRDRLDELKATR